MIKSLKTRSGHLLGACQGCGHGIGAPDDTAGTIKTCYNCQAKVILSYVFGEYSEIPCDGRCMGAVGPNCACACGGTNHGRWFVNVELVPTFELAKVQAKRAKTHAAAKARAEKKATDARTKVERARDNLIAAHPALVWLTYYPNLWDLQTPFLSDMRYALTVKGQMSDRQITAAVNAVNRTFDRAEREEAREREAAALRQFGVKVPTGVTTVTGEVATVKWQDSNFSYSGGSMKMLIVTPDGWKVWGTAPTKLLDAAGGADNLKGRTVTFTATLTRSDNDDLFGFFKSPKAAALTPQEA